MHKLYLLLVIFLLGCATTAGYERKLASFNGATELELIRAWGPPQQTYETNGFKFLTYSSSRIISVPGVAPNYTTTVMGNTAYTQRVGGYGGMTASRSCQTTFELKEGIVVSWKWQGNDCKSR